jgi:hypothetical protein
MTAIVLALITAAASIVVAAVSYMLTKALDRAAELRKQKLDHYRELLGAISGIVGGGKTEDQERYARATNVVALVASQNVIAALMRMRECSRADAPVSTEEHDAALIKLLLAIRRDLGVRPKDDPNTFHFRLYGFKPPDDPHSKKHR